MSPSSVLSRQSFTDQDRSRLRFSFQVSNLREAVNIVAGLRTIAADVTGVHPSLLRQLGRRDWIVTLTTPPIPLTWEVIQLWEAEMLAVEHRWPGCHFLGWRTRWVPRAPVGSLEWTSDRAGACQRRSQRELVMASLLRCPPSERRKIVHGQGVPR
jgi:hypothetical protein